MKRLLDIVLALCALLVGMPFFLLIAVGIWLDDGRPLFFTQTRAGREGAPFRIWKFRTLHLGPKDPTRPQAHETRMGRWLRRWGLDELPQLWNVLRGDMSLIGPRPTLPEQVAQYGPFEHQRLQVRPGLTGWAQIHGRNALPWPERIRLDVWYVEHRSLWLDLRILLRTPLVLLRGHGVYDADGRARPFQRSNVRR